MFKESEPSGNDKKVGQQPERPSSRQGQNTFHRQMLQNPDTYRMSRAVSQGWHPGQHGNDYDAYLSNTQRSPESNVAGLSSRPGQFLNNDCDEQAIQHLGDRFLDLTELSEPLHVEVQESEKLWRRLKASPGLTRDAEDFPPVTSEQYPLIQNYISSNPNYSGDIKALAIMHVETKKLEIAASTSNKGKEPIQDNIASTQQPQRQEVTSHRNDTNEQWTLAQYSGTIGDLRTVQAIIRADFHGISLAREELKPLKELIPDARSKKVKEANSDAFVKAWDEKARGDNENVKTAMRRVVANTEFYVNYDKRHLGF